jgi:hypothetical protein
VLDSTGGDLAIARGPSGTSYCHPAARFGMATDLDYERSAAMSSIALPRLDTTADSAK